MDIILASGSPRRRELLQTLGIRSFRVLVSSFDESSVGQLPPAELVRRLAAGKAAAVAAEVGEESLVIAADTVVALEEAVLGKPTDGAEAKAMLTALSGNTHRVYTGVTVRQGSRVDTRSVCTQVTFRPLTPEEIDLYVRTGESLDKAGAYGIQGYGAQLVEGICGDYFNVMGLPLCTLAEMLRSFGLDPMALAAGQEVEA